MNNISRFWMFHPKNGIGDNGKQKLNEENDIVRAQEPTQRKICMRW